MLIVGNERMSQLAVCRRAAGNFQLTGQQADDIIASQVRTIQDAWLDVCGEAELGEIERKLMWRRQFLNPYVFQDLPAHLSLLARPDA